ncbi:hypothetical protein [Phascolarctobacterium succinatutens]|uniref:hypothetical protein n=1 Tax=Phascolarctobacterium succinatutens TaxID=626940 RepID=UPI0023F97C6C|nr:hypothetical protein [Phascolarctobacterium succinatutens]
MQHYIISRKALRLQRLVKRIMPDFSAVHGNKAVLATGILTKIHILSQPAFNASALIVIATGAFIRKISSALKAKDIKITHHLPYIIKAFY